MEAANEWRGARCPVLIAEAPDWAGFYVNRVKTPNKKELL
jgi:hypothetical protein